MKLIDATCPHCGASLKTDGESRNAVCKYCGASFLIDDEVKHIRYDNAEEAGYEFEKGRQRAREEARQKERAERRQYSQTEPKKEGYFPRTPQYAKPAETKRRAGIGCLGWLFVFLVLALVVVFSVYSRSNRVKREQPQTSAAAVKTSPPAATESQEKQTSAPLEESEEEKDGVRDESKKGRGRADRGSEEPHYVGVIGYTAVEFPDTYKIEKTDQFQDQSLWTVPTYRKDKQFWEEDGSLPHKTEVIVREQDLKHEKYGNYSGHLLVERTDDGSQYYIDVKNFITKPYWTYQDDLREAALTGDFVAEYNQVSDYYPVDSGADKLEIPDGTAVLVTGVTGTGGKFKKDETGIEAIVWKQWRKGYGGVKCHFNEKDLTIKY